MTDLNFIKAFDEWWSSNPNRMPTKRAQDNARAAFFAGCRAASAPKPYRFQAGKWVVTVQGATLAEAKREAVRKLDERAWKLGATTPPGGWQIRQIR